MSLNLIFRGQSRNLLQENCLLETEWLLEVGLGDVEKRNQPEEGSEQEFVSGFPPISGGVQRRLLYCRRQQPGQLSVIKQKQREARLLGSTECQRSPAGPSPEIWSLVSKC